ncbi:MAG TPA: hypothetical protein VGK89_10055 [Candidatus Eisenbacteria bacterium]|jgi:hypothetical protein
MRASIAEPRRAPAARGAGAGASRARRAICASLALAALPPSPEAPGLPPIVFVSRHALPGEPGAIPGLGPHHRAVATGGRLMLLDRGGRVRPLLPEGALHDASDPAVSPDGARVAFAGLASADGAWRLYVVGLDGRGLAAVTGTDSARDAAGGAPPARYDDLDPCWISERTLAFASTRYPQRAQYADLPVTNLYRVDLPHGRPRRLTSERNGAEEPCFDPASGRVLFARWWYNRYHASDRAPGGLTTRAAEAIPADSANLWQVMEMWPDGTDPRLAAGWLRTRRSTMAYQPAVLEDGTVLGVYATNLALSPSAGGTGIQAFERRFDGARRLAGADPAAGDAGYGGTRGLAAPAACAPAALPGGRVLFAYDPGARGDFGIWVMNADGSGRRSVVDLPGTLELDPAPVVRRSLAARNRPRGRTGAEREAPAAEREPPAAPATDLDALVHPRETFRFQSLDVFAGGPAGSEGGVPPPRTAGARIRFFATLARPAAAGGDTAVLVREAPVGRDGAVDETGLPAGTPMFEQIVDGNGRVLRTARGPAQGLGSNAAPAGETVRCVGCHLGHSTLLARRPRAYGPGSRSPR